MPKRSAQHAGMTPTRRGSMRTLVLILLIFLIRCASVDPNNLWVEGVMETENILGDWQGLVAGDQVQIGSVTYASVDTVHWHFKKQGQLRNDSLYYTREYHPADKNYDVSNHGFAEGIVWYVRGDGLEELVYGHLRFRQPHYDSLWVKSGDNSWEKLRRR